jgi:hypothetical protein
VELDIRKYFDTIDHEKLVGMLRQRVRDGVILRLVGKWLNAGVMEDGALRRGQAGTPQGGVISPLLANMFLHEVADVWFHREVQPRLRSRTLLVRYADDAVMLFEREGDALRVMDVLRSDSAATDSRSILRKHGWCPSNGPTVHQRAEATTARAGPRALTFSDSPSTGARAWLVSGW